MSALAEVLAAIAATRYLASDRTVRVNDGPGGGAVRSVRVGHLVRVGHTLCGRSADHFRWQDTDAGTLRCGDCAAVPAGHATHLDLGRLGLTYRQIDYWSRMGWLVPDVAGGGQGSRRTFPPGELRVAAVMAALTAAGLNPRAAARVARGGELPGGVRVVVPDLVEVTG